LIIWTTSTTAEGDQRSSEGRVDLGIIQWRYKEDEG